MVDWGHKEGGGCGPGVHIVDLKLCSWPTERETLEGTQEVTVQGWNYVLSVQKGSTRAAKVGGTEFCESIKLFTIKASNA